MNNYVKGVLFSYSSILISILISIVSVPLSLNYFGKSNYGLFSITNDTISYLSLVGFGLPSATSIIFAKIVSKKYQKLLLHRSLSVMFIFCFFTLTFLAMIYFLYPNWIDFIAYIDKGTANVAKIFIGISIVFALIKLPLTTFNQILIYMNRLYLAKMVDILSNLSIFISLMIVVYFKLSMIDYALMTGFLGLLISLFCMVLFLRTWNTCFINFDDSRSNDDLSNISYSYVLSSGLYIFFTTIGAVLIWSSDSIVISHFLGLNDVAEYSILFKVFSILSLITTQITCITSPLYPKFLREQKEFLAEILYTNSAKVFPIMGGIFFIAIFGFFKEFLVLWTRSSNMFVGYTSCFLVAVFCYFFCSSIVSSSVIVALNYAKFMYKWIFAEAITNLIISIILVQHIGIPGIFLGTLCAHFIMFLAGPVILHNLMPKVFRFDYIYLLKHIFYVMIPTAILISFINIYLHGFLKLLVLSFLCGGYCLASYILVGKSTILQIYGLILRK